MIRERKRNLFPLANDAKPNESGMVITAVTSSAQGTGNTLDFDTEGAFVAPFRIQVWMRVAATSAGAPTLAVKLQSSEDGETWVDELTTRAFALASLTVGTKLLDTLVPPESHRYVRVLLVNAVASTTFTAGKVDGTVIPML